ncbi:MAG: aldehyde dehydrogenase [Bacteroidia bacterium]|nr:aldehyde dehydrogenase [Bacteroidia bacterium]
MEKILNFINGKHLEPVSQSYIPDHCPMNGEVYAHIPDSDERDVEMAVNAALDAFRIWKKYPAEKRAACLFNLASLIEKNAEEFARAETIDNGKPITLSRSVDIPRGSANFRFYAHALLQMHTEAYPMDDVALNYVLRQPVGVAGCISPWNLPLYLFSWKVAPALAAGCTVVAKPSELTPMTAYMLSRYIAEAGFPDGVFNIVHGLGAKAGNAIVSHPKIPAISFTGGTVTGKHISSVAAPMFKKLSLELGGKNPNIIFADCDFDAMMKTTLLSSFSNQGQICLCGSRIYVEESIYEKFKQEFVARTKELILGNPLDEKTRIGAVVSQAHKNKILGYIELAKKEGGTILCGGHEARLEGPLKNGYYVMPTIIEGLSHTCRTNQEEIFGPVVTIQPFRTEEEVLEMANSTMYGLSSTLWTNNLKRAHRMASELEAGIVWVNGWLIRDLRTPFGGMKASGIGREGGLQAIEFFTEEKNVCIKL